MTWGLVAVAGATLVSGYMGAEAAGDAAAAQGQASEAGIAEQRRQFDLVQQLMKPYVEAGTPALQAQQAMLGLGPAGSEQAQIEAVRRSPAFQSMLRQGEESILQRASATGGLRGGNIQAAGAIQPSTTGARIRDPLQPLWRDDAIRPECRRRCRNGWDGNRDECGKSTSSTGRGSSGWHSGSG